MVVVDVVAIVTTSVPDPEAAEDEAKLHVAGLVAPLGPLTAQARSTVEVNEPMGATVTVEVLPVVAPAGRERLVGLAIKPKLDEPTAEPLPSLPSPRRPGAIAC